MNTIHLLGLAGLFSLALVSNLGAAPQGATSRASLTHQGGEPVFECWRPDISDDGRFVVFASGAPNLVPSDIEGYFDVFVRDMQLGTTTRVSVSSAGVAANSHVEIATLSRDGRFVVMCSVASNLVVGDGNLDYDIFVHDRQTAITERVSVSSNGAEATGDSFLPTVSPTGRYVVFTSSAADLVPGDTNQRTDVFVRDRLAGTTVRASLRSGGGQANGNSFDGSITPDGRLVVFESQASDLVAGDTNGVQDVFVHDLQTGITTRVSVSSAGVGGSSDSFRASISDDGRWVAFTSYASNLVAGDSNSVRDVFVHDRLTGQTRRVSVVTGGLQGNGHSNSGRISGDGRFVGFLSEASNLITGDTNGVADGFVHELATGLTTRVTVGAAGEQGNGATFEQPWFSISGDGRWVSFSSASSNLVNGDTNGKVDVFRVDRGWLEPWEYCSPGTTTHGCRAQLSASAQPSASFLGSCVLSVAGVEGQRLGLFFYGIDNSLFAATPWGSGTSQMCVKAPVQRSSVQATGGTANFCDGSLTLDWNLYQQTHPGALGAPWSSGRKVYVQAWFRDPPAPKASSLSDAIELTYQP